MLHLQADYLLSKYKQCLYSRYMQDSVDAVEEMLKKQEDFEKMLAGQEDKFHMLIRETKVTLIIFY